MNARDAYAALMKWGRHFESCPGSHPAHCGCGLTAYLRALASEPVAGDATQNIEGSGGGETAGLREAAMHTALNCGHGRWVGEALFGACVSCIAAALAARPTRDEKGAE